MERDERTSSSLAAPLIVSEPSKRNGVVEEAKRQLWLAGPLMAVSLLQYCLQIISVMFVGHLGQLPLSGASIATSFGSVTGFSFLIGMSSALDTLSGQSFGAKQYHKLGIHMQRAMLVLLVACVPLALMWAYTEPILVALGQDPAISAEAGRYARLMIPSLFAFALLECLDRFLQTQSIVFPMVLCSAAAALLHLVLCWALVFKSELGSGGAAIANSVSYWVNVLLLALYVKFSPSCSRTWTGFSKEALHDVVAFIRLAIPSALMVCLEMWSYEMVVLLSGLLPHPELETSVLSICLSTASTVWMIPYGLSGAVSTRVSNELGAGRPQEARLAVWVAIVMTLGETIVVGLFLVLIRNAWGHAYSNDTEVINYVASMMPLLALSHFLEGMQCVLSGNARGCGWQKIGAYVNLGSYYLVGLPSAILFAFVWHMGGKGLWMGIICALLVQSFSLLIVTVKTNWEEQAKLAKERVNDSEDSTECDENMEEG